MKKNLILCLDYYLGENNVVIESDGGHLEFDTFDDLRKTWKLLKTGLMSNLNYQLEIIEDSDGSKTVCLHPDYSKSYAGKTVYEYQIRYEFGEKTIEEIDKEGLPF